LRWQHPLGGVVLPLDFISVAEETGLIGPIGQWVLEKACRQIHEWQTLYPQDPPLYVSVNLSAKQFAQRDLIDHINLALSKTGLSPAGLKVEITESTVMDNLEQAISMLGQVRALGVEISIDDFGTGYSSLAYLHRFPISMLKVDRSFVSSMTGNQENVEIVRTIVMLAHNLRMKVVAEGVEAADQVAQLRRMGCEYAQGYFFSRPLSAEAAGAVASESSAYLLAATDRILEYDGPLVA
jgi:EAL domain-containing protein (putative c-di-GMP-specific phosphodiesterase class I)